MTPIERNEYTIPAAEFARICGTTRDTLRYYEKQKVLLPWKDPENGYHYYSYAQIGSFYFISTLRSVNYSAKEIRDYLLMGNYSGFLPLIRAQKAALEQQREDLDRKIRQLSLVLEMDTISKRSDFGKPFLGEFPEHIGIRMAPIASDCAFSLSDIARDIQDHIHLFPDMAGSFPAGTAMDADAFLAGDYRYIQVVNLYHTDDASPGMLSGKKPDPGSIEAWDSVNSYSLPTRHIAFVICRDSDGDIRKIYKKLASFVKKKALTMLTPVFSISFLNMIDPDRQRRYLKYIFVCVDS